MQRVEASAAIPMTASRWSELWKKEDWWAIWIGLGVVAVGLVLFAPGTGWRWIAVLPPRWSAMGQIVQHFAENGLRYGAQFAFWLALFGVALDAMGFRQREFIPAFACLYVLSTRERSR